MNTININSPVSITAIGFGPEMDPYPKRMEWRGRTYQFIDKGIKATIRRGESVASTVTLSDGDTNFCLRRQGSSWTLLRTW